MRTTKWKGTLWTVLLIVILVSCTQDEDRFIPDVSSDTPNPTEKLNDSPDTGDPSDDGDIPLTRYRIVSGDLQFKEDYTVQDAYKSEQSNREKHQRMWRYFKNLIPVSQVSLITEFVVFYGNESLAGYVSHLNSDLKQWEMGLAIDLFTGSDTPDLGSEFAYTCIHEFGHVLTLNNTQITTSVSESACTTYYPGEGCAQSSSHIYHNYQIGWADIWSDFTKEREGIYDSYPDRFVTDYAASNPGEDIAEVFTAFVLQNRPTGQSIANKKILKLWENNDLINLRDQIRQNVSATKNITGRSPNKFRCGHKTIKRQH